MLTRTPVVIALALIFISVPEMALCDAFTDITNKAVNAAFSEAERQAIEKYYQVTAPYRGEAYKAEDDGDNHEGDGRISDHRKKNKGKGGWKNKKNGLPKGIQKKLERGGTLPPGIAKRNLPSDLQRKLPPAPAGYERIEADGQVLLTNIATGVITDIINIGTTSGRETRREQPAETREKPEESAAKVNSDKRWWQFWKD